MLLGTGRGGIVREFGVDLLFIHSVVSDSFGTPWTVACPAPLSMGFSRQEHWSGLPFPSPGNLPVPWTEPMTPALQTDSLPLSHLGRLPLYLKWITNKVFLCIAQGTLLDVCPARVGRRCGGEWVHVYVAESLHGSPEAVTTLLIGYTPTGNKKFRK